MQMSNNNNNDLVISAITCIHSNNATQQQRTEAQQFLDSFIQDVNGSLSFALSLLSSSSTISSSSAVVIHFCFHVLSDHIEHRWKDFTSQQQQLLKSEALNILLRISCSDDPNQFLNRRFIYEKCCKVIIEIALRSYPQEWPDFMPFLMQLELSSGGRLLSVHFIFLVFRSLFESIVGFNVHLPETRRRDIQLGLSNEMDNLFPFIIEQFHRIYSLYEQTGCSVRSLEYNIILSFLEAFSALSEWVSAKYLFHPNFLSVCCVLLNRPEFMQLSADTLVNVAAKRLSIIEDEQRLAILTVWQNATNAMQIALTASYDPAATVSRSERTWQTLRVLSQLTRSHGSLINDAKQELGQLKHDFLSVLGMCLADPSPALNNEALELWLLLFRHHSAHLICSSPADQRSLCSELFKIVIVRSLKTSPDNLEDLEMESRDEFNQYFSQFRSSLLLLVNFLVGLEPLACLNLIVQRYQMLLSTPITTDHLNKHGCVTTENSRFIELEGIGALLESYFRVVTTSTLRSNSELISLNTALFQGLIQWNTADPLLQTRRQHVISVFTSLFEIEPSLLHSAIEVALSGVAFRPQHEINVDWTDLSEDSRACRRRAIYTLTHISRKMSPAQCQPVFDPMCRSVLQMVESGAIADDERIALYEFLVSISLNLPDKQITRSFIDSLLTAPLQQFTAESTTKYFANSKGFAQLLLPSNLEHQQLFDKSQSPTIYFSFAARQERVNLLRMLHTFNAVFKTVCALPGGARPSSPLSPTDRSNGFIDTSHSFQLLHVVLPRTIQLLARIYSIRSAEMMSILPNWSHSLVTTSCASYYRLSAGEPSNPVEHYVFDVRKWLDYMTETCLSICMIATRSGPSLYSEFQSSIHLDPLISSINTMHLREIRFLMDKYVHNLIINCPDPFLERVIVPVTSSFISHVDLRVSSAWSLFREGKVIQLDSTRTESNSELEIYLENDLREFTRAYIDVFNKVLQQWDLQNALQAQTQPKRPNVNSDIKPSNEHPLTESAFFRLLLTHPSLSQLFLNYLITCLSTADTATQSRSTRLSLRILPLATPQPQLHPLLGQLIITALQLLSTIVYRASAVSTLEMDLVTLVKDIYTQLMKMTDIPRRIFLSIDKVESAEIMTLESSLSATQSDKKIKQVLKNFLSCYVMGKQTSLQFNSAPISIRGDDTSKHIQTLTSPVTNRKPQLINQSIDSIPSNLSDLFGSS